MVLKKFKELLVGILLMAVVTSAWILGGGLLVYVVAQMDSGGV